MTEQRFKGEAMDVFGRVGFWNQDRGLDEYDCMHEYSMLDEELTEYLFSGDKANEAKELSDIIFVAVGSLIKLTGSPKKAEKIFELVCNNNDLKGKETIAGKVIKDEELPNVEELIESIL